MGSASYWWAIVTLGLSSWTIKVLMRDWGCHLSCKLQSPPRLSRMPCGWGDLPYIALAPRSLCRTCPFFRLHPGPGYFLPTGPSWLILFWPGSMGTGVGACVLEVQPWLWFLGSLVWAQTSLLPALPLRASEWPAVILGTKGDLRAEGMAWAQVLVEGKSIPMPCGKPHFRVCEDMQWHREVWRSLPFITCDCGHVT